jgi:HTH-type transcriptional regulator / antitoxin HipB
MYFQEIANLIQFHRKKAALSRNELADLAGVGKTVIFDIEHGKSTVQYQSLAKVLVTLNICLIFQSPLMPEFQQLKLKEPNETSHSESA